MKLFNLQHKLLQTKHRITREEFVEMNLPKDQFETLVKMELYKQVADHIMNNLKITITPHDEYTEFMGRAYFMDERDMLNVLNEVLEMDAHDRDKLKKSIEKELNL